MPAGGGCPPITTARWPGRGGGGRPRFPAPERAPAPAPAPAGAPGASGGCAPRRWCSVRGS
ncbi:hypothetical protein EBF04_00490 [Streptomyces sp. I6]|nr:hypothetical protein EBF04_00490 [Streptomyces sp. I6]